MMESMEFTPVTLDADEEAEVRLVLATLDAVVAEAGDEHVYVRSESNTCLYVRDGQADCLAARVLHKLGMSLASLSYFEGTSCDNFRGTPAMPSSRDRPDIPVGEYGLITLRQAQMYQDRSEAWGQCRDAAHRWARDSYGIEA